MKSFRKFKTALLLALVCIGVSGTLSACVFEDGHGGHERHWH
jgi:hypothetical protein